MKNSVYSFLKNFESSIENPFLLEEFELTETKTLINAKTVFKLNNVKFSYWKRSLNVTFDKNDFIYVLALIMNISVKKTRNNPEKKIYFENFEYTFSKTNVLDETLVFEEIYNNTIRFLKKKENQIKVIFFENGPVFSSFTIKFVIPIFSR